MDSLQLPSRLLMGPGPANIHPRVRDALGAPLLGHLDPVFIGILGEVQDLLRSVFGTRNPLTLAVSGTGSAGIESCLGGLIEPNDRVVAGVHGFFGGRMAEMAVRAGAQVTRVDAPWGRPLDLDDLRRTCRAVRPRMIAVVHAETSTGVHQPLEDVAQIAREQEALLVVDCVTSLGGIPLVGGGRGSDARGIGGRGIDEPGIDGPGIDELGIDAAASCSQKCLGSPPGLAPVTVSPRAAARMAERRKPTTFYLDLPLIARYWSGDHAYHHTAPVSLICALREALRLVAEEGQAERWRRHAQNGAGLVAGLEALGLEILAPAGHRLPMLTAVRVPPGVDEAAARRRLLDEFNLEIGGGLGELAGRVWRIGLMGETSRMNHVILLLATLGRVLGRSPQSVGQAIEQAGLVAAAGTDMSRVAGESR